MAKKLLSAIPIATFRDLKQLRLNVTTGAFLIKIAHLISNRIIKVSEACQLPYSMQLMEHLKLLAIRQWAIGDAKDIGFWIEVSN